MSNFPWPIITDHPDTSDYSESIINLDATLQIEASGNEIRVRWNPTTTSPFINELLIQGKACWIIEFHCPKTLLLRRLQIAHGGLVEEQLSFNDFRGDVDINVFIKCTTEMDGFRPSGLKDSDMAISFELRTGDIIGVGHKSFPAEPSFLQAPGMRTLFKIRPVNLNEQYVSYRYNDDGEYFTIVLEKELYKQFSMARLSANPACRKATSALIVLPALVLLVQELCGKIANPDNLTPAEQNLMRLIKDRGVELGVDSHPIEVAMVLLEKSQFLATCFEKLSKQ